MLKLMRIRIIIIQYILILRNMVMVHLIFLARSQQISYDIRNSVCRGEKWENKDVSSFSAIKLCFVINVLNNKTTISCSILWNIP